MTTPAHSKIALLRDAMLQLNEKYISYFMTKLNDSSPLVFFCSKKIYSPRNGGTGIFSFDIWEDFKRENFLELTLHYTGLYFQDLSAIF